MPPPPARSGVPRVPKILPWPLWDPSMWVLGVGAPPRPWPHKIWGPKPKARPQVRGQGEGTMAPRSPLSPGSLLSPGAAVTPQAEVPPHPSASDFLPEHVPNTAELRRHPAAQPRAVPTSGRRRGPHRNPTLQRPGARPGWGKADPKEPMAEDLGFFCLRAAGGILAGLGFLHGERAALKKNSFRVDGRAVTCSRLGVGAHGGGRCPQKAAWWPLSPPLGCDSAAFLPARRGFPWKTSTENKRGRSCSSSDSATTGSFCG